MIDPNNMSSADLTVVLLDSLRNAHTALNLFGFPRSANAALVLHEAILEASGRAELVDPEHRCAAGEAIEAVLNDPSWTPPTAFSAP